MDTVFSAERRNLVEEELRRIINSEQFANAPIVRAFLEFVVDETIAGHGGRIKAYTIAVEAFGRSSHFDPSSDTIVRTTAGRVRKALQAYYGASRTDPRVVISLPKGGYIPAFEFRDARSSRDPRKFGWPFLIRRPLSRRGRLLASGIIVVIAAGLVTFLSLETRPRSLPHNVVIDVLPVEYTSEQTRSLAREIDIRLAPALSRIRLAEIIPPGASLRANGSGLRKTNSTGNSIFFNLKTSISRGSDLYLLWELIDVRSSHILWTGREVISEYDNTSINAVIDRIAFQVLGTGGAVSSALERYRGEIFSRPTCISRAQIMEVIENDTVYPEMRDCLERIVTKSPGDASAWAVLSTFYTLRSYFYAAGSREERARLVEHADRAAERAAELAPGSYLTKVALMHLALRQGRITDFDALQQEIRKDYPGDIYLQIRIATRIARLGRGKEALEIFDKAQNEFGVNLKNWTPGIAVAYFAEGEYEQAHRQMLRATSDLRFVLVLKTAILGKLGMRDEAAPIVRKLVETNPDIKETFYVWLTGISWAKPLVLEIADGLAKAGLVVDITSAQQSSRI